MGPDLTWIDKLKVPEIKDHLDKRGLKYNKKLRKSEIADILRAAVESEAGKAAEAPPARGASEPPAVQPGVQVSEGPTETAISSQQATEDVQPQTSDVKAQRTYTPRVQESSREDTTEPGSAPVGASLQFPDNGAVSKPHAGPKGAAKKSESALAESDSANLPHLEQPTSSTKQDASLRAAQPEADQKEQKGREDQKEQKGREDEKPFTKPEDAAKRLEGDNAARESHADAVPVVREGVHAKAPAAGPREDNEDRVPHVPESDQATPMDLDAGQEVDAKPSQPAEDAGVGLADEHMEEQLDYGEDDINPSQEVKPAVEAAPSAKPGSKRAREERQDEEKRSKGAKSNGAADVKSSLERTRDTQEAAAGAGKGEDGKGGRGREARAEKEESKPDSKAAIEERKREALKQRAEGSRQDRREAEPSKREDRRREEREGRDRSREHRERVSELKERAAQQKDRGSEVKERVSEQKERVSEQKERVSEQKERVREQKERVNEQKDKAGQQKGEVADKGKAKEEPVVRKRKYSPIPAPPPRANKDRDKGKAAEPESEKRRKTGHEDGENGKLGRGGSAEVGRRASVFDRLDSRQKDEKKKADNGELERKGSERGAAAKEELEKRGSGLAVGEGVLERPVRGPGAPRSREKPSCALRIDGFVRPLHQKQVLQLLSATGTVKDLWMPSIKTHAFAIFGSVEEAEATRQALWDVEWPDGRNNTLKPKFVPEEEAKEKIAMVTGQEGGGPEKGALANGVSDARELVKGRDSSHHKDDLDGHSPKDMEEKVLNLDDLFRKTSALPVLYWQPLTEEEIAAKEAALASKSKAGVKEVAVK